SFAYPFMSASFILVFLLSMFLFGETFTWGKVIGLLLITAGIFVTVKL
ncbi:MAG: EamA family transporter, partial [Firmicutes bacterium]|nr:EamA family transporter [Bacillota bacterium]